MEDVLEVYIRPHDPAQPLVCLDETSKQLVAETRTPLPAQPGRPARYDYEYERNGTASLFMLFAPLEGWRDVKVTERRTAIDYAQVLKELSDVHFALNANLNLVQTQRCVRGHARLMARSIKALEWRRVRRPLDAIHRERTPQ
jgi:DDE superfamily endonuclease